MMQGARATSESDRTKERYRAAGLSVLFSVLSRLLAALVLVVAVRQTAPYLGVERFGAWMTVSSLAAMLSFLDLGAGNALTNLVATAAANGGDRLRRAISGGLAALALIAAAVWLLLEASAYLLPWERLIKVSDPIVRAEVRSAIDVFVWLFALSLFANGLQRVLAGLQRAWEGHLFAIGGSVAALAGLVVATSVHASIAVLLACMLGGQVGANLLILLVLSRRHLWRLRGIGEAVRSEYREVARTGGLFLVLQVGTMMGWGVDTLIISSTIGAKGVAVYSVAQRLLQILTLPAVLLSAPLWPAYADAYARGDMRFIRSALKRSMLATLGIVGVGLVVVAIAGQRLTTMWTTGAVTVSNELLAVSSLWALLFALGTTFAMFLNGCFLVRPQVLSVVALCLIATPLKILAVRRYGVEAMVGVLSLVYAVTQAIVYGVIWRRRIGAALRGVEVADLPPMRVRA